MRPTIRTTRLLFALATGFLAGCPERIEPPRAVIAAAPADVAVGSTVQLDGSKSTDPGKRPLAFQWTFSSVPAGSAATLSAATTARPFFVADAEGAFEVTLVVSNGVLTSEPVKATVNVGACGTHVPVVESITPQPQAPGVGEAVGLTATVSDADMDAPCGLTRSFSYLWSLTAVPAGSSAALEDARSLTPWFEPDAPGTYQVSLVVTDELGRASAAGTLDVEVGACGTHPPEVAAIAPLPAAPDVGQVVGLTADVTDDDTAAPCGLTRTFAYAWQLERVPAGSIATLAAATSRTPWFEPDVAGTYEVSLVVTDELGRSGAPRSVEIDVGVCGAAAPVVLEVASSAVRPAIGQVVQLGATVSDADAVAPCAIPQSFSYDWWIQAAPAGSHAQLNLPGSSNPSFTVDVEGEYVVAVVITDGSGRSSARTTATVTASACGGNTPDVTQVDPTPAAPGVGSVVQLSPSVIDGDTDATCGLVETYTYAWSLVGQPAGSNAQLNNLAARAPSFVPDIPGDYLLSLVVTDGTGHASEPRTFTVTASACGSAPPAVDGVLATPGAPNVSQPVELSASISDADNAPGCDAAQTFTHEWTLLSTPLGSETSLHLAATPQPWLTPDVPGTYVIGVTVSDSTGRRSPPATVEVVASTCGSAAPVALVGELAPDVVAPAAAMVGPNLAVASMVQLTGSGSTDADNAAGCSQAQTLGYRWSFLSVPAGSTAVINNPTVVDPSFTADVAGTFVIGLTVTDSTGRSSTQAAASVTADPAFGVGVPVAFTITTLASGGVIRTPRGVTEDAAGNVYVVQGNSRITKIAAGTNQLSTLTTGGFLAGPNDIAYDATNNQLFVTAGGNRIVKVALNGNQSTCASQGASSFRGIEVYSGTGGARVIAADRNNGALDFFNPATCVLATVNDFNNNNGFNLFRVWGVAAANIGGDNVFTTDESAAEVWRNVGGAYASNAGANTLISADNVIATPRDVVITPAACATRKLIVANNASGELLLFSNANNAAPTIIVTGLQRPVGLYVENQNRLLVTDETGNAVFRLSGNLCAL